MARLGACIVVALGLVATAAQAEPRDLIANGGFERGLDGWSFDGQWVRDETVARTGKACVTGRLQRADGVRALLQSVSLRQDAVYELRFWARSSSSNKLSVWIRHEGRRDLVTQMLRVPRDWTLQTYTFEVRFTGEAGLELNLPTTFDGPPGQAWVDDVELIEHVVPPSVPVSDGLARSDSPFVASDDAGRLYYAWIESARSRDWLWVAGGRPSAAGLELDVRQMLDVNATSVESVSLAGADRGAWGAVSVETPLGWDILAFRLNTQGIAATRFVTRDAAVDIRPVVAWDGERGWVAWESNRDGRRQIWASVLPPDDATPPVRLSDGSDSAYFPPSPATGPAASRSPGSSSSAGNTTSSSPSSATVASRRRVR